MLLRNARANDAWNEIESMCHRKVLLARLIHTVLFPLALLLKSTTLLAAIRMWYSSAVLFAVPVMLHVGKDVLHVCLVGAFEGYCLRIHRCASFLRQSASP
jgi:hypothetical protein